MEDNRPPTSKPSIPSIPSPAHSTTTITTSPSATSSDLKSPTARPPNSSKLGDPKGRSSETIKTSPTTRQAPVPQQKAMSTKNPVNSRSQTPQQNNFNAQRQSVTASFRDGQRVRITLSGGAEYEGIYASNQPDSPTFLLRMVQQRKPPADLLNGAGKREQSNMSFQKKEVVDGRVIGGNSNKVDGKAQNGNRSSFRTDSAISSGRPGGERALKRWVPDAPEEVDGSLEKSSSQGGWDQFAENERLFGLKTDYDENIYTTAIDKSHPQYSERVAAAERKAREIERTAPTTSHVAEERIMDFVGGKDQGGDEEDKYSGVRRQDFPPLASRENKYTPPARRAPTGQATVVGAPVDPAIISSQIKGVQSKKQSTQRTEDNKSPVPAATKTSPAPTAEVKTPEPKSDANKPEAKSAEAKPTDTKATDPKSNDKSASALRPSAAASRAISPQGKTGTADVPSAASNIESDVLKSFKSFATQQRVQAEKVRSSKIRADTQVKLQELKKFADNFKLTTPVPNDLISIIAKDPAKQKQIQERALKNAEEMALVKSEPKAKDAPASSQVSSKAPGSGEQTPAVPAVPTPSTTATASASAATDSRGTSRATGPQHTPSPSGVPNRHGGARSYGPQYRQQYRNDRSPAQPGHNAGHNTGNLAERIRNTDQNRYSKPAPQHIHYAPDLRLPPTGPANTIDPNYGRRLSAVPPAASHLAAKLNPSSHEFRPSPFAPSFNPNGPSGGSSPRSAVNTVVEPPPAPSPLAGQLIRRKTRAVDAKKCSILSYIKTIQPPPGRNWDDNGGLRPSYDTLPTWKQIQDDEKADSYMRMTYKEYFEKLPFVGASMATPNPPHAIPGLGHAPQFPFHVQHGTHGLPRQSPHMAAMQMHPGQHSHVPHGSFNSSTDDHRMMHSNSAQSYASPRLAQIPMYPPQMNSPAQLPYSQPAMPQFIPGTPQMNQYRSFSNTPQYMPPQSGPMTMPMMPPQQFVTPQGAIMSSGPQIPMYPGGHPQFMTPTAAPPPQPMPGSNGYPSPGRPAAAPMMSQQGSQQGQPVYGMSPNIQYQQPVFAHPHAGQGPMRGYSNPGPQQFGTSPQQMHHYGPPHRNGGGGYGNKHYQGHNNNNHNHNPRAQAEHAIPPGPQGRTPDGQEEGK